MVLSNEAKLALSFVYLIGWLICLQLVLASASGSIGKRPNSLHEVKLTMKSWATLLAHICGFACIDALGKVQHLTYFSQNSESLIAVVPIGAMGQFSIYVIFEWIRWKVAHADDGQSDEYEEAWDEYAAEAENDVMGLSLSFLTVQVVRFAISGVFPDVQGVESPATAFGHPSWQVGMLSSVGIGLVLLIVLSLFISKALHGKHRHIHRLAEVVEVFASTGCGWCFYFAAKWGLYSLNFTHDLALLRVALALLLSFVSLGCIFLLDKIADLDTTGDAADEAIRTIVEALGLLVGFSWEQAFDMATDNVVQGLLYECDPAMAKLMLSVSLIAIVFPAWVWYILPTVLRLEDAHHATAGHDEEDLHGSDGQEDQQRAKLSHAQHMGNLRLENAHHTAAGHDNEDLHGSDGQEDQQTAHLSHALHMGNGNVPLSEHLRALREHHDIVMIINAMEEQLRGGHGRMNLIPGQHRQALAASMAISSHHHCTDHQFLSESHPSEEQQMSPLTAMWKQLTIKTKKLMAKLERSSKFNDELQVPFTSTEEAQPCVSNLQIPPTSLSAATHSMSKSCKGVHIPKHNPSQGG